MSLMGFGLAPIAGMSYTLASGLSATNTIEFDFPLHSSGSPVAAFPIITGTDLGAGGNVAAFTNIAIAKATAYNTVTVTLGTAIGTGAVVSVLALYK